MLECVPFNCDRIDLSMRANEKRVPFFDNFRRYGAILLSFRAVRGGWLGRLADSVSAPNARKARRRLRRWLRANGLTIVLVAAIMIFAWIFAVR
jgi:hypothetical protein